MNIYCVTSQWWSVWNIRWNESSSLGRCHWEYSINFRERLCFVYNYCVGSILAYWLPTCRGCNQNGYRALQVRFFKTHISIKDKLLTKTSAHMSVSYFSSGSFLYFFRTTIILLQNYFVPNREAIHVPFMARFVVYAKRTDELQAQLRMFCVTDDKEDKALERIERFIQVAKSRDVEVSGVSDKN